MKEGSNLLTVMMSYLTQGITPGEMDFHQSGFNRDILGEKILSTTFTHLLKNTH